MPSIFGKSGSTAARAKTRHKSIRGTISAPIPIPMTPDDNEFPIRNPGSAKASVTADDEFPMRTPGAGISTPVPLTDRPGSSPEEQPEQPGPPLHDADEKPDQPPADHESSLGSATEREQEPRSVQVPAPTDTPASAAGSVRGSGGSRTDLARDNRPEAPSTPPPAPPTGSGTLVGRTTSRSPPSRTPPRKSSPPGASPSRVTLPARRATNPALNTARYSVLSDAPSKQTAQSKDAPLRKKSTLRSALGRLFGRGRKKNGSGSQSDPTALNRPSQRSPKRSASLPLSEYDRPLRSHSIGPDDIMAIESARNSLHAEVAGPRSGTPAGSRRRAATTGGHTLLRPHLYNREFGAGLSPRPASAQGRASRAAGRDEPEDPNEIGRAITSDSAGGLRRRSRSLSGLQDFAGIQRGGRRRSDEIRYWRESYDPGFMSPLSSNAQDDVDDPGMADVSAPESPAVEKPPKTPPQPFNFGLLSKEMVGMKITHAASMDMRLGSLESRTLQLERVVDQLCHAVPGFKGSVDAKDAAQPSSSRRSLDTDTHSQLTSGDVPAYQGSLRPPPPSSDNKTWSPTTDATNPPRPLNRPTSTSTVRGVASLPALAGHRRPDDAPPQSDLIAQLRADLDNERAARQALEAQVKKLSERVNTLSTTMFAMVRGPSESRSQERLASSPPSSSLLQPPKASPRLVRREQQLSVFETEEDDEDDGGSARGAQARKKDAPPVKTEPEPEAGEVTEDDFQTPREDRVPVVRYGAFGEELRPDDDDDDYEDDDGGRGDEDDPKRKKAARTLSLSQLTLGKGQRVRI
ncbi:6f131888-b3c6-4676-98c9-dd5ed332437b [Thermothielavioides terrestris]|uniref:6f131888-b3c6-4676-98c9-dd5ed332437b n=1 Tax=Thermothielavioides terrestris TaxID=2587410 RepID=A0A446B8B3_9PEZI|nr:6f131888-b3c6-4676-98c9-dd5ed332437b [Thermothielavioides terrestris]